jgi:hypothetical protein
MRRPSTRPPRRGLEPVPGNAAEFLRGGTSACAAGSCVQPESEALRTSVNYVESAADPAAACARCAFFTADPAGGACGSCQILSGPVDATGHCDSFSPPS